MEIGSEEYYDSMIDCSAVKSTDGQIWTGKRHHHCFATIRQAGLKPSHKDQGFVTMSGKYVTRLEAAALVIKTGQCKLKHRQNFLAKTYTELSFPRLEYFRNFLDSLVFSVEFL